MFEDSVNDREHRDYDFWSDEPVRSANHDGEATGERFDDLDTAGEGEGWADEATPIAAEQDEQQAPEVADGGEDDEQGSVYEVIERAMAEANKPVEVTDDQLADADKVSKATVVFELTIKQATFTRKLAPEQIIADQHQPAADAKMLKSTKKLIVCRELDEIERVRREFKDWLELYKCRTKMLRGGMALIPLGHMDAVEERYKLFKSKYYDAVRAFLAVYLEAKRQAKDRLGVLYEEGQYPSVQEVADAFKVSHRWIAFDAPRAMKGMRAEMIAQARQKIQADLAEAAGEMKDQMRGKMMEFTHWLVGQLQPAADGKRRQITETKFEQMQEFLRTASTLNVIGDEELDRAIEMANKAIKGVDVKDLKASGKNRATSDQLRQQMAEAFEQVKAVTEGWVVNQTRVFLDEV